MHSLYFIFPVIGLFSFVFAGSNHPALAARHHHNIAASRSLSSLVSRAQEEKKKCPNRSHKPKSSTKPKSSDKPKPTKDAAKPSTNSFTGEESSLGVLNVKSDCGKIGALRKSTTVAGPMGSIDWLNCGVEGDGWRPPYVGVDDLIAVPLREALKSDSSPFQRCNKYLSLFEKHAAKNHLPPIMLASFALQESSCNPATIGGGGEQGLMQITKDKCGGAPRGNCLDPDFNIGTAARFFAKTLAANDGNVLVSVGQYNGWSRGMTKKKATAARYTKCCRCQNNLDYLHQFMNGWMQNIDAYSRKMGKYFNLDHCPH